MDLNILKETPPWDWPEDTGKRLLAVLSDRRTDAADRLLAAELAGEFTVINDELADALLTIVKNADEHEKMRSAAVISLGPAIEYADTDGFDDPEEGGLGEQAFHRIQEALHALYLDDEIPRTIRRKVLEVSVRAPQNWHSEAVRKAYSSGDKDWLLTAVFSMRWIEGFENEILQSLKSKDKSVRYQAVCAAGVWEIDAAWPVVFRLVTSADTEKVLLLAAIDTVAAIRPYEAGMILGDLADSADYEIAEAAMEAMNMVMDEEVWDDVSEEDEDET